MYTTFRNNLFLTEIRKFQYADFSSFMIPIGMPKKEKVNIVNCDVQGC